MKKLILAGTALAVVISASPAAADVGSIFGTQSTAAALGQGSANIGFVVGLADVTSFGGTFDIGLSNRATCRLKVGIADADNTDTALAFGGDLRFQVLTVNNATGGANLANTSGSKPPFDLSIGLLTEHLSFEDSDTFAGITIDSKFSVFQFGAFALGSYPFIMKNGHTLSPYTRLNIRSESAKVEVEGVEASDSDIEAGLGLGVAYELTKAMNLYGEFQFDGNDGLFLGMDFRVM